MFIIIMSESESTIQFKSQKLDRVFIRPGLDPSNKTINVYFDKYRVNMDICKSCCEDYKLYINGKLYEKMSSFQINPSNCVSFRFQKEIYNETDKSHMVKNIMIMKFNGGDRIRAVRYNQYCSGSLQCIYTRGIYLTDTETNTDKLLGMV
jgi:hypothetical protein